MELLILQEANEELNELPANELRAIFNALETLRIFGPQLGYPHPKPDPGWVDVVARTSTPGRAISVANDLPANRTGHRGVVYLA